MRRCGTRPPSGPATTPRSPGNRPHPPRQVAPIHAGRPHAIGSRSALLTQARSPPLGPARCLAASDTGSPPAGQRSRARQSDDDAASTSRIWGSAPGRGRRRRSGRPGAQRSTPTRSAAAARAGRTISDRSCFAAIVFMARTSTPWRLLPARELGSGSPATCWRRLTEWAKAGVFDQLHLEVLDRLGEQGRLDWSRASVDTMSVRARVVITLAHIPSIVASRGASCSWSATVVGCRRRERSGRSQRWQHQARCMLLDPDDRRRCCVRGGTGVRSVGSPGVGAGSWAKISRPRSFFPSGLRSFHPSISARVRSAQPSTVVSRLMKKSTARARR